MCARSQGDDGNDRYPPWDPDPTWVEEQLMQRMPRRATTHVIVQHSDGTISYAGDEWLKVQGKDVSLHDLTEPDWGRMTEAERRYAKDALKAREDAMESNRSHDGDDDDGETRTVTRAVPTSPLPALTTPPPSTEARSKNRVPFAGNKRPCL